jgi:adenine-specific DNA-methyltransferase
LAKQPKAKKQVEALKHDEASRKNIPTAEYQSLIEKENQTPIQVAYERRNRDLDPQLIWRGKDEQDWSDLVVPAPPLYIQEKVHPKVLIDDLLRRSSESESKQAAQIDLFADFNGLPSPEAKTEFYQHDANWSNRMILGDSLQVMASLAEREGLRGKVQCIYIDPPYGIKFNSNFQWSTTSRTVEDGNGSHISREPEQVKAFRDTWRDGIHSYLTYLRDRLVVARDLLSRSGHVFVQIGDENVHLVRAVMDEVFGTENFCSLISFTKTSGLSRDIISGTNDFLLWFAREKKAMKVRKLYKKKTLGDEGSTEYFNVEYDVDRRRRITEEEVASSKAERPNERIFAYDSIVSGGTEKPEHQTITFRYQTTQFTLRCGPSRNWKAGYIGTQKLWRIGRLAKREGLRIYKRYFDDFPFTNYSTIWGDTRGETDMTYVVQTARTVAERAILLTTDPGDLVLDPTCGSGTTAFVSEQWGRRWITIDTSRVALALARARIMGSRYPYYLLADSREGQTKAAEIAHSIPSSQPVRGNIRQGFVYERVPHVTLKSIANNAELDVIWEKAQARLESLREKLNAALKQQWEEWEIPREAEEKWPDAAKNVHAGWWEARISCQKEIDASIAAKAEFEYLYDKPYQDNKKVRVAGPFTVESLSPHRVLGVDENDNLVDSIADRELGYAPKRDFASMILENLRIAGVQQAHKEDSIAFTSLIPWPGNLVCADGRYVEGSDGAVNEKRAAIFIGPEFGTVSRPDLVEAARQAADAGFDVLIACAFNFDAHATELSKLGRLPILKARMNADLHMAEDLKNTGKGNLFVIFGEPDLDLLTTPDGQLQVKIKGVDVFHPSTGEVRSDGADGIACWFIDTDYNEESFFVRHAYFLGQNDPYSALKTTLKAEINEEAWASLHSDTSRPFPKPLSGRIAVKVINHLGDEVMKVFRV